MLHLLTALFGGAFTLATAYGLGAVLWRRTQMAPEIVLATGAAAESGLVFLLLLCHAASWAVFLAVGVGAAFTAEALRTRRKRREKNDFTETPRRRGQPRTSRGWIVAAAFGAYGFYYLVNALAPEIQPDGITYHLGLASEYARLGGFPARMRFYDALPLGMEMLFTVAFSFGRHAAAKLVELGLFTAAVPLIFRIGRKLGLSGAGALVPAVFYWTAPVIGLTGTSAYNDAALVFFTLAAFYLLLVWRESGERRYLLAAGALAGFCYAIKLPGIFVGAAALLFVLATGKGRMRNLLPLAAGLALTAAPWMIRDAVVTGNPIAPLGNSVFPNAYFHLKTERELDAGMRSRRGVTVVDTPWELALGDGFSGTFGPMLFVLPLGLLALRRREGRWCLAAAAILAIPGWSNSGARFLMPAAAVTAFALAMVLPSKAAWAAVAVQALVCWPPLLNAWQPPYTFRLHELPWRAALGLESEPAYLRSHIPEYNIARMVEGDTPPDARIYSLMPVATAYAARDVSVSWQSAEGDRLADALRTASNVPHDALLTRTASWPLSSLRALRFRASADASGEWSIAEIQLYSGEDHIFNSPLWSLRAWPNVWEAPLAFDSRHTTVWRTWQPVRRGMFLEVDLDHAQNLSGAAVLSPNMEPIEVYGRGEGPAWRLLTDRVSSERRATEDLRLEAVGVVRRAGYRYLLAPLGAEGNGQLGQQLYREAPQWGLAVVGEAGPNVLFKLQ